MVSHNFLQKVSKKLCSGLCNYQCYLNITHAFELRNVLLVFIRITYDFIHDDSYTDRSRLFGEAHGISLTNTCKIKLDS